MAAPMVTQPALWQVLATLIIWPYTNDAAEEFGRVFTELKRAGRSMQQIEIQIGAIARTLLARPESSMGVMTGQPKTRTTL